MQNANANTPEQMDMFAALPREKSAPSLQESPKSAQQPWTAPVSPKPRIPIQQQAVQLQAELQRRTNMTLSLTITNNRRAMMSVRHTPGNRSARVRLHHIFLTAPDHVKEAVADWILHPRSASHNPLFQAFFRDRHQDKEPPKPKITRLVVRGVYFNLKDIFDALNQHCFQGTIQTPITWGKHTRRNTHSIRLGSYDPRKNIIRIHPRLDQSFVPDYVVRYIVYHEMLHAHLGVVTNQQGGRRQIHTRAFKEQEARLPEYAKALTWTENPKNLNALLKESP